MTPRRNTSICNVLGKQLNLAKGWKYSIVGSETVEQGRIIALCLFKPRRNFPSIVYRMLINDRDKIVWDQSKAWFIETDRGAQS